MTLETLGYIAAPTGAGRRTATGSMWGFRGRRPAWCPTLEAARRVCRGIEATGRRDGGRGRDCYIVAVHRDGEGVSLTAGGGEGGLSAGAGELTVGCSAYVEDAAAWLDSRPRAWKVRHGIPA